MIVSWKDCLNAFGAVKDKRGNRILLSLSTFEVRGLKVAVI